MRAADAAEASVLGKDPRRALRQSFRMARICRAMEIDGEVAAIGGLGGDLLADAGSLWLITTAAVERAPLAFVRALRREVVGMLAHCRRLEGYVAADYHAAVRMLELLGFTLATPSHIGSHRALFRRFWIEA